MALHDLAAALIQVFEGCKLQAYRDSGGVLTIGIGHTASVTPGMTITPEIAGQLFAEDQAGLLALVASKPLLEGAALVSFGFNCGRGALVKVLVGDDRLDNPVHTQDRHGNVLPGLVARRHLELQLIAVSKLLNFDPQGWIDG